MARPAGAADRRYRGLTMADRVLLRVTEEPGRLPSPCLVWQGARGSHGYGQIEGRLEGGGRHRRVSYLVHRLVYEQAVAPIPDGLVVDHRCLQPLCVNVTHMEIVTRAENSRRGQYEVRWAHRYGPHLREAAG